MISMCIHPDDQRRRASQALACAVVTSVPIRNPIPPSDPTPENNQAPRENNLEEPPPEEKDNDEAQHSERPVLPHEQLPVDPHGGPLVLPAVVPQAARQLAHPLQAVPPVQQVLDVLGHDLGDVAQLVVQAVEVLGGAGVGVRGPGALYEGVKVHEGVGAEGGRVEGLGGVCHGELAGEVGEVGEGELAGVVAVGDGEEDDVRVDYVACGGVSGVVSEKACRTAAQEKGGTNWMVYWPLSMLAWASEFRVSFLRTCRTCPLTSESAASACSPCQYPFVSSPVAAYLFVVDGCAEHQAYPGALATRAPPAGSRVERSTV